MERTCRCGKPEEPKCEAWWGVRALNPPEIGRGPARLYDAEDVDRECQYCGYQIPDPYDDIGSRPVECSTCYEGHGRTKKRLPGNDLPAVCDCARYFLAHGGLGWQLDQCDAYKCFPPAIMISKKQISARQGNLF